MPRGTCDDRLVATSLRLLGTPLALTGAQELALPSSKPVCLLYYLAVRGEWVTRDELALVFWPDSDEGSARHALRQLVYRVRGIAWADGLEVSSERLRWTVRCDVQRLRDALARGDWSAAVASYGGRFLEGVELPDAPGFEAWCDLERRTLEERYLEAAVKAAAALELRHAFRDAAELLRGALRHDPLAAHVVRALLRCLAMAGELDAAASVFTRFESELAEQLGVEPDDKTRALMRQIAAGEHVQSRPHNLPGQPTPFVGREAELRSLATRITDPGCRLVSLVGPGGMGKTRLALQAASDQIGAFRDGVYYVPLAAAQGVEAALVALAEALNVPHRERGDVWAQLIDHLREREILVLLDNLEHLLMAAPRLAELLEFAPHLTLLITTREPLDLRGEWVMDVHGLALPEEGQAPNQAADSMRLFAQAAGSPWHDFSSRDSALEHVARVCRKLAGVPLAIELAASWAHLLTPGELVKAIENDLGFLSSSRLDVPERQRSLRGLFEGSWERLPVGERDLLMRMACFVGDADLDAVKAVAGGELPSLLKLVRRSLLKRDADGRFTMHPLIRQFVGEELASVPDVADETARRHTEHYVGVVSRWTAYGAGAPSLSSKRRDLTEVRRVWQRACEAGDWDSVAAMLPGLLDVHDVGIASRHYLDWLSEALGRLPAGRGLERLRGRLLAHRAACVQRLGRYAEAERDVAKALELLAGEPPLLERAIAWRAAGNVAYLRGDHDSARAAFTRALEAAESVQDTRFCAACLTNLGLVAKSLGEHESALHLLERARVMAEPLDDALRSQTLNNLATVRARLDQVEEAEALLRKSATLKRRLGDDRGLASTLTNLANLRARAGDYADAEHLHQESLRLARLAADRPGVARSMTNLADLARVSGDLARAADGYRRAMALKREIGEEVGALEACTRLVDVHLALGDEAAARQAAEEGARYALACGRDELSPVVPASGAASARSADGARTH